jgi:undecaprenyl-diphosphatase
MGGAVNDASIARPLPTRHGTQRHREHWFRETWPLHPRVVAQLLAAYVVIAGAWIGLGLLLTGPLDGTAIARADGRVAEWFVDQRTPLLNTLSQIGSHLSETWVKILVTAVIAMIMLRIWRRWFEAAVVCVALILEALAFVTVTTVVGRERPDVERLDGSPIGSSFPSGHVAAAVAYAAIAVVVFRHTRNRLARGITVVICLVVPVIVGLSRMYRGMHFLTDVIAGALLGVVSVLATVAILKRTPEAHEALDDGRGGVRAP